jgi:hypothetical protein
MSKRRVQVVILCEDRQQEVFARYFLVGRGFDPRLMRPIVSPNGMGSAEQFVRERFATEVRAYRSKRNQIATCLVVLVDADIKTLAERLGQLESALLEEGLPRRQADEKIGIFIPKRNIETWIHYAQGEAVDEITVYPRLPCESDCKLAVKTLATTTIDAPLPAGAPPSLHVACDELQRIL